MAKLNRHRLAHLETLALQGKTPDRVRHGVGAEDHHEDMLAQAVVMTPAVHRRHPTSVLSTPLEARFDRLLLSGQRSAAPIVKVAGNHQGEFDASHFQSSSSSIESRQVPG